MTDEQADELLVLLRRVLADLITQDVEMRVVLSALAESDAIDRDRFWADMKSAKDHLVPILRRIRSTGLQDLAQVYEFPEGPPAGISPRLTIVKNPHPE